MKKQHFAAALILMIFMLTIFPAHGETVSMNVSGVPNLTLSVDPTGKAEGFSAIVYNNPNGLPTSEANAIAETSEGFIWIGSYAGLVNEGANFGEQEYRSRYHWLPWCSYVEADPASRFIDTFGAHEIAEIEKLPEAERLRRNRIYDNYAPEAGKDGERKGSDDLIESKKQLSERK